jgi:hypothetical protein
MDTNITHAMTAIELDALATTAVELWDHANQAEAGEYLSSVQREVLGKAHAIYTAVLDGDAPVYTRDAVIAAYSRAYSEAENIADVDIALTAIDSLSLADFLPAGAGVVTGEAAAQAYNNLANAARELYHPEGSYEDEDSVRADSCGDLVVNLAVGFLRDFKAETDDIIAAAWKDLDLDHEFPTSAARRAAIVAAVTSWF